MKLPKLLKIASRTSSITNAFVQHIIPSASPSEAELVEALGILGMTIDNICCAYCGETTTNWDHFRPLVENKRPTGFLHEIRNLVPACLSCNTSKSGAGWRSWMVGPARRSPKTRRIPDIDKRIERLTAYEKWGNDLPRLSLGDLVTRDLWETHWKNLDEINVKMHEAERHADLLRIAIRNALKLA